jgi:hypothetical protein
MRRDSAEVRRQSGQAIHQQPGSSLAPPLVLSMLASIYVWPQLQQTLSATGGDAGSNLLALATLTNWMAMHWILIALPLNTWLTMISAKFLMDFDAGQRQKTIT